MNDDEIKDLAVSLRPRGIEAHEIPAFVDMIISIVRVEAMRWKYDPATGQWFDSKTEMPDTRPPRNGCKEIAEQGYAHVNTGNARPQKGDLKPSDSLIHDLQRKAMQPLMEQRAAYRARLEELDRQIESGQIKVSPDARLGTDNEFVDLPNGSRMLVPADKLAQAERAEVLRKFDEAAARAYPQEERIAPVYADGQELTPTERRMLAEAETRARQEICRVSNEPDPKAKQPVRDPGVDQKALLSFDPHAFPCIPKPN